MGKSSPSPPPAPDPAATAAAQAAANKEASIASQELSMINQNTPYGNLEYTPRGESAAGTPQYTATQTLAPAQQQMLDLTNQAGINFGQTANQQLDNVRGTLAQPIDYSALGAAPQINEDTRNSVRDSILARMQPQQEQDRARLETSLANQGIGYGSDAYNNAFQPFNQQINDSRLAADQASLGQASQLYGLEANQRDRAVNEMAQQRQIPLNELNAMLTQSQVQGPSFVSTPQNNVAPADIMGATYGSYNGDLNAFNQNQSNAAANRGSMYGALGTLGSAAFMFSDRRLKTNIERVGTFKGLGVYLYRYVWGGPLQMGVMADEVRKLMPEAVKRVGGFDMVDYRKVLA